MKYKSINSETFLLELKKINPKIDHSFIDRVFEFTTKAHHEQKRKSGVPYITHPLNVAYILAEMQMDTATVSAGLLHDTIEDTIVSYKDVKELFGKEIAEIVEGVTKITGLKYKTNPNRKQKQAENYRKLLIFTAKDIRVIIVKLADRLHNMRTLQYMNTEKRLRISRETMDIYAPLANRFGIAKIKWELEDLAFKYLEQEEYQKIVKIVATNKRERDNYIKSIVTPIEKQLQKSDIRAKVEGRSKHFYSIYKKHIIRKMDYSELYDLAAIRIIVSNVEQCYTVLGLVHKLFEPIGRIHDYIARPKPNGYQSLHTIVVDQKSQQLEVQIRTEKMHMISEEGVAAHWRYKEFREYSPKDVDKDLHSEYFNNQLQWIRKLLKDQTDFNSEDFIESLRLDLYPEIIIVSTPNGDMIKLPKHATPLDFAFAIHTDLGFKTIGAKVDGRLIPLRTELQNGNTIEILKSNKINASKDWLDFLMTSRARQKIRSYFHKKEMEDAITLGKEIFIKRFRKTPYKLKNTKNIQKLLRQLKLNDLNTFFINIGTGELTEIKIKEAIKSLDETVLESGDTKIQAGISSKGAKRENINHEGIKISDINNMMLNFANCCKPVQGDDVIGYITRGRGLTIHRRDCNNSGFRKLMREEKERILDIEWSFSGNESTQSCIKMNIVGKRKTGFLMEILAKFKELKIDLEQTQIRSVNNLSVGNFKFFIQNTSEMEKIIAKIYEIKNVTNCQWENC